MADIWRIWRIYGGYFLQYSQWFIETVEETPVANSKALLNGGLKE
jgi:hypothetical protein